MGPEFGSWASFLTLIANLFSVNIDNVVEFKNGVFWIFLDVSFGLCGSLIVFFVFNLVVLKGRFPQGGLLATIKSISDLCLPIIGNLLFLPIVSICLEVFICTETSGDDIGDAFLHKDCYVTCWTGDHLYYLSISAF
jgi:hypothetical protein